MRLSESKQNVLIGGATMKYEFLFSAVFKELPAILQGLGTTAQVSILSIALSTGVGISVAFLATSSRGRLVRRVLVWYIEIMRNTPLLVQLYFVYFGLSELGLEVGSYGAILIALTFCNGAYLGEIIRAGIESIPRAQTEAGISLGLTHLQVFFYIVFPQALRSVIPPITNQYVTILLSSSLASVVAVEELTATISRLSSFTFRTFEFYAAGALLYMALALTISAFSKWLEYWITVRQRSTTHATS